MKGAPDKIYVAIVDMGSGYITSVSPTPSEGRTEYIRADLVEKLLAAQRQIDAGMPVDPTKPKSY